MRALKSVIAFGFVLFSCVGVSQHRTSSFTLEDGIPQVFVYSVEQDKEGHIWIGTGNGLAMYDGQEFEVYDTSSGLAESFCTTIGQFGDSLLIGHYSGGISVGKNGKFKTVELPNPEHGQIQSLAALKGGIFFSTQNSGLKWSDLSGESIILDVYKDQNIFDLIILNDSSLLVYTDQGIFVQNGLKSSIVETKLSFNAIASNGKEIICISGQNLFSFDHKTNTFNGMNSIVQRSYFEQTKSLKFVGDILYGHVPNRGIWSIDFRQSKPILNEKLLNDNALQSLYLYDFEVDFEGNIWTGTGGKGVVMFHNDWLAKHLEYEKIDRSSINIAESSTYLSLKNVLLQAKYVHNTLKLDTIDISNSNINDIAILNENEVWYGTELGLEILSSKKSSEQNELLSALSKKYVSDINLSAGFAYISTFGHGLFIVDVTDYSFTQMTTRNGLLHNDIHSTFNDSKGNIWLGTHHSKISFIDINSQVSIIELPSSHSGLNINCAVESSDGRIWIGTEGTGLWVYHEDSLLNLKISDGLSSDYIYSLAVVEDDLWIGHKGNLGVMNTSTFEVKNFGELFSLGTVDFFPNSLASNNEILMCASSDGIFIAKHEDDFSGKELNAYLKSFTLNGIESTPSANIDLPFGRHTIELKANVRSYSHRNSVFYQYQIAGDYEKTSLAQRDATTSYNGLSYGDYIIYVRAAYGQNNFGEWKPVLNLSIAKPFYLTWWFITLLLIAIIGAPYLFYRLRLKRLESQKVFLEKTVRERTAEIITHKDRMEKDLTVARDIQMSMLPKDFTETSEIKLFAQMKPAREVGGDFYDFYFLDKSHLFICVGDVSGKSAPAALFMAYAKSLTSSISANTLSTSDIISNLNTILEQGNSSSMFVTVFCAIIDTENGSMVYTNAGHNPTIVKRKDGSLVHLSEFHGPVVGALGGIPFKQNEFQLQVGDQIIVYTDGVTEAMNSDEELYSDDRFANLISKHIFETPESLVNIVVEDVLKYTGDAEQTDDITVLTLFYDPN